MWHHWLFLPGQVCGSKSTTQPKLEPSSWAQLNCIFFVWTLDDLLRACVFKTCTAFHIVQEEHWIVLWFIQEYRYTRYINLALPWLINTDVTSYSILINFVTKHWSSIQQNTVHHNACNSRCSPYLIQSKVLRKTVVFVEMYTVSGIFWIRCEEFLELLQIYRSWWICLVINIWCTLFAVHLVNM